jgi:RNA 2',3'-cyclic 3'-phosphodiesterase
MRLFVAVQVPDDIRGKASSLSAELPPDAITPVQPKNMHLTLRFIGEVDEKAKDEIVRKLEAVRFKPFGCSMKGVGVFPSEDYVRVVWAGVESGGALVALAKSVIETLAGIGEQDPKPFSAHMTIVRVRRKIDPKAFLARHKNDSFGDFTVSGFDLIESELGPGGPAYKKVASFHG